MTSTTSSPIPRSWWSPGIGCGAIEGLGPPGSMGRHLAPSCSAASRFLTELRDDLKARRFQPLPVRERIIPKPVARPSPGIPTARDRWCRQPSNWCSSRSSRRTSSRAVTASAPGAEPRTPSPRFTILTTRSYEWVVEGDIKACFDEISHVGLMDRVRGRIGDKRVLGLVKAFLKPASSLRTAVERESSTGTPQGGILSPLLSNIALSVLDEHFAEAWESEDGLSSAKRRRHGPRQLPPGPVRGRLRGPGGRHQGARRSALRRRWRRCSPRWAYASRKRRQRLSTSTRVRLLGLPHPAANACRGSQQAFRLHLAVEESAFFSVKAKVRADRQRRARTTAEPCCTRSTWCCEAGPTTSGTGRRRRPSEPCAVRLVSG